MKKQLLLLAMLASFALLTACSSDDEGPKPEELPPVQNTANVKLLWEANPTNGTNGKYVRLTPAVTYDRVFVAGVDGNVAALNAFNGKRIWEKDLKDPITTAPELGDGKVYVGTAKGKFYALDASTGKQVWKVKLPNQSYAEPGYGDGLILAKTIDDKVVAMSAKDGSTQWTYEEDAPPMILQTSSRPVVSGNVVINGFSDGKLVLLSLYDGKLIWEKQIADSSGVSAVSQMVGISADPVQKEGTIYVASYQGNLSAVEPSSGDIIWTHKLSAYSGVAATEDEVFVSDARGYLWAFSRSTGEVLWRQDKLLNRQLTRPEVIGDYVVVADDLGYVHWMRQDNGKFVARTFINKEGIIAAPMASGNKLFVMSNDGHVQAYAI